MTESETTISVRGEAAHTLPPDFAVLHTSIAARDADRDAALDRAGSRQSAAVAALGDLGGVPLSVATVTAALTWSTTTISAQKGHGYDAQKRPTKPVWRVHVPINVTVRDLTLLPAVAAALSAIPRLQVSHVRWGVDRRNEAWPVVRAAAITDAIAKARDYATALGGSVTALVHVADAGLLGGREHYNGEEVRAMGGLSFGGRRGAPGLDPQPQEITAVIEARFTATVAGLTTRTS